MEPNLQTPEGAVHHHHLHPEHHPEEVRIHLNDRPVELKGHRHTGLQIFRFGAGSCWSFACK